MLAFMVEPEFKKINVARNNDISEKIINKIELISKFENDKSSTYFTNHN